VRRLRTVTVQLILGHKKIDTTLGHARLYYGIAWGLPIGQGQKGKSLKALPGPCSLASCGHAHNAPERQ
jgi:hypothetical protein